MRDTRVTADDRARGAGEHCEFGKGCFTREDPFDVDSGIARNHAAAPELALRSGENDAISVAMQLRREFDPSSNGPAPRFARGPRMKNYGTVMWPAVR